MRVTGGSNQVSEEWSQSVNAENEEKSRPPGNAVTRTLLGWAYEGDERKELFQQVVGIYEKLIEQHSKHPDGWYWRYYLVHAYVNELPEALSDKATRDRALRYLDEAEDLVPPAHTTFTGRMSRLRTAIQRRKSES